MKNILLFILLPLIFACNSNQTIVDNQIEVKDSIIKANPDTAINLVPKMDTMVEMYNSDLIKFRLKGKVKSLSINSNEIDENGDRIGMGGFYESYDFNEQGFISALELHGCCGYDPEYVNYKYNDKNQLTHRIFLRENETDYYNKEKYFYDANGDLVKVKIAGFDQVLNEEISYKYNDNGTIRKKVIQDIDKNRTEIVNYTYSDLRDTETHLDNNGELKYKIVFIYDEKRNLIKREKHLKDGHIQQQKFTYKYDSKGNWIEKTDIVRYILPNGSKEEWRNSTKTTRGITYY